MAVGIVVVGHAFLPDALVAAAGHVLATQQPPAQAVGIGADEPPEAASARIAAAIDAADSGAGVLLLADLFGASPCNAARAVAAERTDVGLVTGANLGMLLRACNYSQLALAEVAETAAIGGTRSIIHIS